MNISERLEGLIDKNFLLAVVWVDGILLILLTVGLFKNPMLWGVLVGGINLLISTISKADKKQQVI